MVIEMEGWDIYKEQGLKELERIKSSKFFSGHRKRESRNLIQKYIEIYKARTITKKEDIDTLEFYPEKFEEAARGTARKDLEQTAASSKDKSLGMLGRNAEKKATKIFLGKAEKEKPWKKEFEKPARQKVYYHCKKLRDQLDAFYKTEEGKASQYRIYFVSHGWDYRIGIRLKIAEESKVAVSGGIDSSTGQEISAATTHHQGFKLPLVKRGSLEFLKIYAEAIAVPNSLVSRSVASASFNWNTIGVFLLALSSLFCKFVSRALFSPVFITPQSSEQSSLPGCLQELPSPLWSC